MHSRIEPSHRELGRQRSTGWSLRPVLFEDPSSDGRESPVHSARFGRGLLDRSTRALNVLVALIGIILTLPVMLVIAVLVRLSSQGPILYRQQRVGLDRRDPTAQLSTNHRRRVDRGGRIFTIYKFRTMRCASDGGGQVWARKDDPRITPVGRFLRHYRLDELPQLFNVLRGDMNVVGPRPEQPKIFAEMREQIDQYPIRQRVLPGITGWAQVNHHYDQSVEDVRTKLNLDLEYIESRSVWQDAKIMARTIPVMIFKKGAR